MRSLRMRTGLCFVLTVSTLCAGASSWNSIRQLMSLQIIGWGVTSITQAVWNTAHGAPFAMTNLYPLVNRLGTHVEPVILLLARITWIVSDAPNLAIGLLALQAIVVTSGALPVYLLARDTTSSEYGAVTSSLLYLLFPAVGALLSFELHLATFCDWVLVMGDRFLPPPKVAVGSGSALAGDYSRWLFGVSQAGPSRHGCWLGSCGHFLICDWAVLASTTLQPYWREYPDAALRLDGTHAIRESHDPFPRAARSVATSSCF